MNQDGMLQREIALLREELDAIRAELATLQRAERPGVTTGPDRAEGEDHTATRRQLLRQGAVAVGAGIAGAGLVGRRAVAEDGEPVLQGNVNEASGTTQVNASDSGATAFVGHAASASGSAIGVRGESNAAAGAGVYGQNFNSGGTAVGIFGTTNSGEGVGILGQVASSDIVGVAVRGTQDGAVGNGVVGEVTDGSSSGAGVLGVCSSPDGFGIAAIAIEGTAVRGTAQQGVGGRFSGTRAAMLLESSGPAPATGSDEHTAGEIFFDDDSNLWLCVEAGTPGRWVQLNSAGTPGTIPVEPFRAYDSRFVDGPLPGGTDRVISVKDKIDIGTGAIVGKDLVPPGAIAVTFNLTIVNTVGGGFVAAAPGDATEVGASSINWAGTGVVIANGTMSKLDPSRQLKIFAGGAPGARTDFIVDITGYIA